MEALYLKSEIFFADNLSSDMLSQSEEIGNLIALSASAPATSKQNDTATIAPQRVTPTPEQIRMWHQREVNKMFHGQSKEINLQNQVLIETKEQIAHGLVLPSSAV